MDYAPSLSTQEQRDCTGSTISFSSPPPACLHNSLVAQSVNDAAPFLRANITHDGKVEWEIRSPTSAELRLFALIMASRLFIGSRSVILQEADKLSRTLGTCKWRPHDHECSLCNTTTSGQALFMRGSSTSDRHYKLSHSACSNPDCRNSTKPTFIKTLVYRKPKKTTKSYEPGNLEKILCVRLAKAIDTMKNDQVGKYGCVLDPKRIKYAQSGFASDVAFFCSSTLDFMYTVNGNPDFSPQFATRDMRSLYEEHVRLLSWHYPQTTMIHVPAFNQRPPLDNPICRDFISHHRGEPIVNGDYTYMTCAPDRIQASEVCKLFFSKELQSHVSTKLYWNWPNTIENHHTEGYWFDPHGGSLWSAPVPKGMTVCASISDFIRSMRSNVSNNYVVANSQELDFVMMKTLLQATKSSGTTIQLIGLVSPVGSTKEARMNGRPFIFFSWWNNQKPALCKNSRHGHKRVFPPLDASVDELSAALRDGLTDPAIENIVNASAEAWLQTHWNGIEYTTSPPPERIRTISCFQKHPCHFNSDAETTAFMRTCHGTYSIRVTEKTATPCGLFVVRCGTWAHYIRHNNWGVVPSKIAVSNANTWEIEPAPAALLSRYLNVCGAVNPQTLTVGLLEKKKALVAIGLLLAAAQQEGITPALSTVLTKLVGEHILVVHNTTCNAALNIAFDCYLAAVNSPSYNKFVRPRNKAQYACACDLFDTYLNRAVSRFSKDIAGSLREVTRVFFLLKNLKGAEGLSGSHSDSESKSKRRKLA